jgi:hypothetical protein
VRRPAQARDAGSVDSYEPKGSLMAAWSRVADDRALASRALPVIGGGGSPGPVGPLGSGGSWWLPIAKAVCHELSPRHWNERLIETQLQNQAK